jgi:arabinose-5-phosphate isomerase
VIAVCGESESSLSQAAEVVLDASCEREACPLGLAPTASAVVALALGDALAMAVMSARGFSVEDYAETHPGGSLGRKLLLRVSDVMHSGTDNPTIGLAATVLDALLTMTTAPVRGVVTVVDEEGLLRGLFTDGDFRVLMQKREDRNAVMDSPISEFMTRAPTTVTADVLAAEALRIMEEREFDNLPVVDEAGRAVGVVDIQDLMKLRVI